MFVQTVEGANMLLKAPAAPNLPIAPAQYNSEFQNKNNNSLRLFANSISSTMNSLVGYNGAKYLQSFYGAWYATTTQSVRANSAGVVTFDSTWLENGINNKQPQGTGAIFVPVQGVYNFQYSIQFNKTTAGAGYGYVWCRVAGGNLGYSSREVVVQGTGAQVTVSGNFMLYLLPTQYFQLMWATDSTVQIFSQTALAFAPAIPSATLTANFISAVPS